MLILLNPVAGGGSALDKWRRIAPRVEQRVGPFRLVTAPTAAATRAAVGDALRGGERRFVAAGGDGTVNLVMSELMRASPGGEAPMLGAIGLGSSNDFHKPIPVRGAIRGVPTRLDFSATAPRDVCRVRWEDGNGGGGGTDGTTRREAAAPQPERYWLLNASIGITAAANHAFNGPSPVLRSLKRASASLAIAWAALTAVCTARGRRFWVSLDGGREFPVRAKNLAVVKSPHFTGALRYDAPVEPASGRLHVFAVGDKPLLPLLGTLAGLAVGRFTRGNGNWSRQVHRAVISANGPFLVEADGEVTAATHVVFDVLPRRLLVCGP
jgi:diacylglycerol kinase family enzyme